VAAAAFPITRPSVVQHLGAGTGEARTRALALVAEAYRAPLCVYIRRRFTVSLDDAEDLTHGFFVSVLCQDILARYDPTRGKFRTYLRACVDRHVAHSWESSQRLKRGGGVRAVSLTDADAAGVTSDSDGDAVFEREWARSVCHAALATVRQRLEARARGVIYEVFVRYDVVGAAHGSRPTYDTIAQELGIPVTQVANHLSTARREFRTAVLEHLRDLTVSDDELRAEARSLLGVRLA